MESKEKRLILLIALFVAGITCLFLFSGLLVYLYNATWFNVGANLIQWSSLFSTEFAILAAIWMYWHRRCGVRLCPRKGEHPVNGTVFKVCKRHHQVHHHEFLHRLHKEKHPHLLGWGESHKLNEH